MNDETLRAQLQRLGTAMKVLCDWAERRTYELDFQQRVQNGLLEQGEKDAREIIATVRRL